MADTDLIAQLKIEGIDEAISQLKELGDAGQAAFTQIASGTAEVNDALTKLDELTSKFNEMGDAGQAAFGKINTASQTPHANLSKTHEGAKHAESGLKDLAETGNKTFESLTEGSAKLVEAVNALSFSGAISGFKSLGSAITEVTHATGGLGQALSVIIGSLGVVAAGTAAVAFGFYELAKGAAESVIHTNELAHAAGASIAEIKGLKQAFAEVGASTAGLSTAFRILGNSIASVWPEIKKEVRDAADTIEENQIKIRQAASDVAGAQDKTAQAIIRVKEASLTVADAQIKSEHATDRVTEAQLRLASAHDKVRNVSADRARTALSLEHAEYELAVANGAQRDKDYEQYLKIKDAEQNVEEIKRKQMEESKAAERAALEEKKAQEELALAYQAQEREALQLQKAKLDLNQANRDAQLAGDKEKLLQLQLTQAQNKARDDQLKNVDEVSKALKGQSEVFRDINGKVNLTDVSTETLFKGIVENAAKAKAGAKEFSEELPKPSGLEVLLEAADAFSKITDATQKQALARRIFGRSATQEEIDAISHGRGTLDEFIRKQKELGINYEEQIHQAEEFRIAQEKLDQTLSGLQTKLGLIFLPTFTEGLNTFRDGINENREAIVAFAEKVGTYVKPIIEDVFRLLAGKEVKTDFMKTLIEGFKGLIDALVVLGKLLIGLADFLKPVVAVFGALDSAIRSLTGGALGLGAILEGLLFYKAATAALSFASGLRAVAEALGLVKAAAPAAAATVGTAGVGAVAGTAGTAGGAGAAIEGAIAGSAAVSAARAAGPSLLNPMTGRVVAAPASITTAGAAAAEAAALGAAAGGATRAPVVAPRATIAEEQGLARAVAGTTTSTTGAATSSLEATASRTAVSASEAAAGAAQAGAAAGEAAGAASAAAGAAAAGAGAAGAGTGGSGVYRDAAGRYRSTATNRYVRAPVQALEAETATGFQRAVSAAAPGMETEGRLIASNERLAAAFSRAVPDPAIAGRGAAVALQMQAQAQAAPAAGEMAAAFTRAAAPAAAAVVPAAAPAAASAAPVAAAVAQEASIAFKAGEATAAGLAASQAAGAAVRAALGFSPVGMAVAGGTLAIQAGEGLISRGKPAPVFAAGDATPEVDVMGPDAYRGPKPSLGTLGPLAQASIKAEERPLLIRRLQMEREEAQAKLPEQQARLGGLQEQVQQRFKLATLGGDDEASNKQFLAENKELIEAYNKQKMVVDGLTDAVRSATEALTQLGVEGQKAAPKVSPPAQPGEKVTGRVGAEGYGIRGGPPSDEPLTGESSMGYFRRTGKKPEGFDPTKAVAPERQQFPTFETDEQYKQRTGQTFDPFKMTAPKQQTGTTPETDEEYTRRTGFSPSEIRTKRAGDPTMKSVDDPFGLGTAGKKVEESAETFKSTVVSAGTETANQLSQAGKGPGTPPPAPAAPASAPASASEGHWLGGLIQAFAAGGRVHGPGGPKADNVHIRVSAGEYVVKAEAVSHYGEHFLNSVNDMRLGGFALGGMVDAAPPPIPQFAEGGAVTGRGPSFTLHIGDEKFEGLTGDHQVVNSLQRYAAARQMGRIGTSGG